MGTLMAGAARRLAGVPVFCALFVILWSSGFIGAKFGLDHAGTFTILFWRYLVVVAVLAVLVTMAGEWRPIPPRALGRHAAVGALAHGGWLAAVLAAIDLGLSAGLAAFITGLQPVLTGALATRVTGEPVSRNEWAGLLLGLLAVVVVVGDAIALGGSFVAHLLPFLAVIAITAASLIDRGANLRAEAPAPLLLVTFWHSLATLAVLAPFALGLEKLEAEWTSGLVFAIVWLAIVVSLAAYGLMFLLLRRLPAPRVASLSYLSPPVTMVMAWLIFGESLTFGALLGLAIASASVWLTLRHENEPLPLKSSPLQASVQPDDKFDGPR